MDRLFRIPPMKRKAVDGSNDQIPLEHRIGLDAGAFTREHLMDKLGFEAEYKDYCKELNKRDLHNHNNLKDMMADRYRTLKMRVNSVVTDYRRYLEKFYGGYTRKLIPLFAFVPINDKVDGIFIQALVDASTYKLVIGEPSDNVMWCEKTFTQTWRQRNLNERAEQTAKALVGHPGLSKELRHRIQSIASGHVPEKLTYNGTEDHK